MSAGLLPAVGTGKVCTWTGWALPLVPPTFQAPTTLCAGEHADARISTTPTASWTGGRPRALARNFLLIFVLTNSVLTVETAAHSWSQLASDPGKRSRHRHRTATVLFAGSLNPRSNHTIDRPRQIGETARLASVGTAC